MLFRSGDSREMSRFTVSRVSAGRRSTSSGDNWSDTVWGRAIQKVHVLQLDQLVTRDQLMMPLMEQSEDATFKKFTSPGYLEIDRVDV